MRESAKPAGDPHGAAGRSRRVGEVGQRIRIGRHGPRVGHFRVGRHFVGDGIEYDLLGSREALERRRRAIFEPLAEHEAGRSDIRQDVAGPSRRRVRIERNEDAAAAEDRQHRGDDRDAIVDKDSHERSARQSPFVEARREPTRGCIERRVGDSPSPPFDRGPARKVPAGVVHEVEHLEPRASALCRAAHAGSIAKRSRPVTIDSVWSRLAGSETHAWLCCSSFHP